MTIFMALAIYYNNCVTSDFAIRGTSVANRLKNSVWDNTICWKP